MKKFFSLIPVLIFLANCTPATDTDELGLGYQMRTTMYKTANCEPETDACLMAAITYPWFSQGDSLAVLLANRIVKNSILDAIGMGDAESLVVSGIEEALAHLDKEFIELKKQVGDYRTGWNIEINTRELFTSDSILVLEINYMTYTGGSQPNRSIRYFNFNRQTGSLVPLSGLVVNLVEFTNKAEVAFRQTYKIAGNTTYEDAGFSFLGNKFTLATNYAFLGDSIKLHYNPDEIAPYAAGDFAVTVALQ